METLHRQVRRAQRRLIVQSFLGKLGWCLFAALAVAALAIGAGKFWPAVDEPTWSRVWIGSMAAAGVIAAAVWTWVARQDRLAAAVEIDRRFGLKERVASSLALGAHELETPIAQALVRDAARRVERIDVAEKFGIGLGARSMLPVVPAAIVLVLVLFVSPRSPQAPAATTAAEQTQIKKSTQALARRLEEKRQARKEAGLEETETDVLLRQLQKDADKLATSDDDRKQTLIKLNELVKDAEQRRKDLSGGKDLKRQLENLKDIQQGPAEKLARALQTGELQKAIDEIAKLNERLNGDELDAQEREQLARQLAQAQEALAKTVDAHRQAQQELKERMEQARREGNTAEADKLQQQLEKLAQQAPQMEQLSKMAQQLKEASQCAQSGDCDKAADALAAMGENLAGLSKELDELETLDEAMAEMMAAKNAMACQQCDGEGCEACMGGEEFWRQSSRPGTGVGAGVPADRKTETRFYDSQVKQEVGRGASVVTGVADGPNRKGQVQEQIKGEFTTGPQETAEAISGQRLPHDYRDHAKGYFDALREAGK